jgi:hypothetical protein
VPQIVVGKKASRINSLHVHVSIRFFIHHQVVLPEERRIMGKKKSFCLFMHLFFDSGFRCCLLTRSASCLPFGLLLMLLTLLVYTIIPIKIALFLLIQIESYIVPEPHLEPWVLLTFGGNVWEVVVVQSCFQNGKFHPHPHGANLYLLLCTESFVKLFNIDLKICHLPPVYILASNLCHQPQSLSPLCLLFVIV